MAVQVTCGTCKYFVPDDPFSDEVKGRIDGWGKCDHVPFYQDDDYRDARTVPDIKAAVGDQGGPGRPCAIGGDAWA